MTYEISEDYLEKIRSLKLLDDDYAKMVFKDENSIQCVVSTLLNQSVEVISHETQAQIQISGGRSLICDICVISDLGMINVEIENCMYRASSKRIRYHISALDTYLSSPGMNMLDMQDIIIIFICGFDPFKCNEAMYHIHRIVDENQQLFDDGIEIILVNGHYIGNDKVGRLIHDFRCSNPDDMYNEVLKERSRYFKEQQGGIETMCKVWEEIRQEGINQGIVQGFAQGREQGIAQGREQGIVQGREQGIVQGREQGIVQGRAQGSTLANVNAITTMMKILNLDKEEVMNVLNLDEESKDMCRKALA